MVKKMASRAFYSYRSFEDAAMQAKVVGYTIITGKATNRSKQFVIFAKQQQTSKLTGWI